MDKASGVYLTLTDKSFLNGGASVMKYVIPMLTVKGELGINRVTATDLEEVLGYDIKYNSNYYGLQQLLENLTYVDVWRLNQNAKLANGYFTSASGESTTNANATSFADITETSGVLLAAASLTPGLTGRPCVKFEPQVETKIIANEASSQTITIPNCNITTTMSVGTTSGCLAGAVFYDSTGTNIVGVIVKNSSTYTPKKVVDGVVQNTNIGTASLSDGILTISLTGDFSDDYSWNLQTFPTTPIDWTLYVGQYNATTEIYSISKSYSFSMDSEADNYWKNVLFGDVQIYIKDNTNPISVEKARNWFELQSGSNGDSTVNPSLIDVTQLDLCDANIMLMNGMGSDNAAIVNRMVPKCEKKKIHMFVDAPAESKYENLVVWANSIQRSEYVAIGARPDQFVTPENKKAFVYPSVNYGLIFARMYKTYGNLNYPPAGPSYGMIGATDLIKCDYNMYADELKTNRINWQTSNNLGTMIWEQRTTYGLNSDLSYIAPVFIIDGLSEDMVNFERNFNFRYMSADDLSNQQSGLNTILKNFVDDGFLYWYELKVPSFAEAQAAGRTLTIQAKVKVTKDSEVINIDLVLTN